MTRHVTGHVGGHVTVPGPALYSLLGYMERPSRSRSLSVNVASNLPFVGATATSMLLSLI